MSREQQLLLLARQLSAVSTAGDWQGLAEVDREVAASWRQLSVQGAWTAAEQAGIDALQLAHRDAASRCGLEAQQVKLRLDELGINKEGWMAYAAADDGEHNRK